ncbi:MAG: hypothetical protein R2864_05445 [Syntrophotaleaceae bacterium]
MPVTSWLVARRIGEWLGFAGAFFAAGGALLAGLLVLGWGKKKEKPAAFGVEGAGGATLPLTRGLRE